MTDDGFQVGSIDHVELSVPDRYEAADWYNEALGFEIVEEFEHWADLSAYPLIQRRRQHDAYPVQKTTNRTSVMARHS